MHYACFRRCVRADTGVRMDVPSPACPSDSHETSTCHFHHTHAFLCRNIASIACCCCLVVSLPYSYAVTVAHARVICSLFLLYIFINPICLRQRYLERLSVSISVPPTHAWVYGSTIELRSSPTSRVYVSPSPMVPSSHSETPSNLPFSLCRTEPPHPTWHSLSLSDWSEMPPRTRPP